MVSSPADDQQFLHVVTNATGIQSGSHHVDTESPVHVDELA
jgi:hypothetical protein